jgi:hypothetical protein
VRGLSAKKWGDHIALPKAFLPASQLQRDFLDEK